MINHARTLLINISGEIGYFSEYPGDEVIDPTYNVLQLPTYLKTIRTRIFGATPDRVMLNYRVDQILKLISTTDLNQYILGLDRRITYRSRPQWGNEVFTPQVIRYSGLATDRLYITGKPISPDSSGICSYAYDIKLDASNFIIKRISFPLANSTIEYTYTAGETLPVTLPFSEYKVHTNTVNTGAAWTVKGNLRPTRTLAEIDSSLRSIGEPVLVQLFGTSEIEPYITFKNCWANHPDFAYRFGGLILAYIYRSQEIHVGNP